MAYKRKNRRLTEEAIIEALEAYQAELTAQAAAVKAEKEVIKSAAEHDDVTLATDAGADTAKTAVDNAINTPLTGAAAVAAAV